MEFFTQAIFMNEIRLQCKAAIVGHTALQDAADRDDVWIALQTILVAAANISKLLWGSGDDATRRAPLRVRCGITDSSPLKDRRIRDAFEHFDRDFETWWLQADHSQPVAYAGRNIGPSTFDPKSEFHHYDPDTRVVTFGDHAVSIPKLMAEIDALYPAMQAFLP